MRDCKHGQFHKSCSECEHERDIKDIESEVLVLKRQVVLLTKQTELIVNHLTNIIDVIESL